MGLSVAEPAGLEAKHGSRLLLGAMLAVGLNLVVALLMDAAADRPHPVSVATATLLFAAVGINGVRFLIWRGLHRHYRFADVMPLTALFFPLIGLVSFLRGEPMTVPSLLGIALITAGAWTIAREAE